MRKFTFLMLIFIFSPFSFAEEPISDKAIDESVLDQTNEQPRAGYLDPELKKQLALADALKPHEIVWLEVVYPEQTESRKVLAISHPPLIPEKQGAILFLHDKEQHADWPEVISPLRKNLPKMGWFTLSVNLPDETRIQLPQRSLDPKAFDQIVLNDNLKQNLESGIRNTLEPSDSKSEAAIVDSADAKPNDQKPTEDQEETEAVDIDLAAAQKKDDLNKIPYNSRALVHVEKGIEYLQSQSYQNIVLIAHRHSAELGLYYIKSHLGEISSPGFALVLIEPILRDSYTRDIQEWFGEDFKAPILEIINRGSAQEIELAEVSRLAFVRAGIEKHRQIFLTVNNSDIFSEALTRRIRQWLEVSAPGMKIGR